MPTDVNDFVNANDNRQVRECYEYLLAGINPSVSLNAQALAHMQSSTLSAPLVAHFKVAANTIRSQQQRIDALENLLSGPDCQDCGVISTPKQPVALVVKSDHHGGHKRVCEERSACHERERARR